MDYLAGNVQLVIAIFEYLFVYKSIKKCHYSTALYYYKIVALTNAYEVY